MVAINKSHWDPSSNPPSYRIKGYTKNGYTGDRIRPTLYSGYGGNFNPPVNYFGTQYNFFDIPNIRPIYDISNNPTAQLQALINASWERLIDKVRDGPASLGETIVQNGQAFEMIANRFGVMYHAFEALRKGRFRYFLREFNLHPKRKHRNWVTASASNAADHWLEYYFGWLPLINDVYDSAHILTKTPPSGQSFRGRAGASRHLTSIKDGYTTEMFDFVDNVTQGGRFAIDNPNLFLLQQVGLANPAQLAWNLLPFSFLVDWVFDVSSFIGGYSDLLGIRVTDPYTTYFRRGRGSHKNSDTRAQIGTFWYTKRLTSLSKPAINSHVLMNLGTSMKRAATAASLLVQSLSRGLR